MDNGHVVVVSVSVGWCAVPCRVHPCTRRRSLTMNCRRRRRPWQHQARKHQLPARHAKPKIPFRFRFRFSRARARFIIDLYCIGQSCSMTDADTSVMELKYQLLQKYKICG